MSSPVHARFEVRRRLGQGGQGVVYAAWDRERELEVALKTLRTPGPTAVLRLKQEFRALADVVHENLLGLHDLVVEDDNCFFTMELVDGVDVVRFIRGDAARPAADATETGAVGDTPSLRDKPAATFDEGRLRAALAQIVAALGALHAQGLAHRDLKPGNVLVRADGHLFVLDYGLVHASSSEGFEGTPAYAAPEQAHGGHGPAVDLYALGVVLFEAITGALPFSGTPLQMLVDKRQRDAPRIDEVVRGVPADLVETVARLLSRDPDARSVLGLSARATSEAPLLGRDEELATLLEAFDAGGGRTVVVEGPSGIGKTSLVRAFLHAARARGGVILSGRCNPREVVPYNAFDGVIDALARELRLRGMSKIGALGRLFPVLGTSFDPGTLDADALRRRAFAELREILTLLPRVVIFVDDFQWADRDSHALLTELSRSPALFVLTRRDTTAALPWAAQTLALSPLSRAASRALLGDRASDVEALLHIADGHPLFLQELARARGDEVPRDLAHALSVRVRALSGEARLLLELVAVAASPCDPRVLASAAEQDIGAALRQLDVLRADHLVRVGHDGAEPFHDRVRDAVLGELDEASRRERHARLAAAHRARGTDPRALVYHLAGSGDRGAAREGALAAASRAEASLAFEHAARLLRDAITHGADADAMKLRLADALANAHRGAEAAEVYLEVKGAARARAAELLLASGDFARGRAVVSELLAEAGRPLPETPRRALFELVRERVGLSLRGFVPRVHAVDPAERARAELFRGVAQGLGMTDNLRAALYNARSLRAALDLGDPATAAVALATESIFRGSVDARKPPEILELARRLSVETGDESARAWVSGADAALAALKLERADVVSELLRAEAYFQERTRGNQWALDSLKLVRSLTQLLLGRIEALRARLPEDIEDARRRGDRYLETTLRRGATLVHLCDGDVDGARRALDESTWTPREQGFHIQHWLELDGRLLVELFVGDASTALERHEGELRALGRSLVSRLQRPRILSKANLGKLWLARAAARKDRGALLRVSWMARQLWGEELGYARVRALLLRAGIAGVRGRPDDAIPLLRETIELADRIGLDLTAAVARRRLAARVGGDEGRALLARSDAFMQAERVLVPERIAEVEAPYA